MNGDRWGMDGPPAEAYSRVTDAGRFRPLHDTAVRLLETLEMTFDVWRVEGYGLDEELEEGALARPSIKLTPTDLGAAPLVIAFTAFPGLRVRCGDWLVMPFPSCGCDACDETADGAGQRFSEMVEHVTSGRFRESTHISLLGDPRHEWKLGSASHGMGGGSRTGRSRALRLIVGGRGSRSWTPWSRR